jgi:HEAT repeat protein
MAKKQPSSGAFGSLHRANCLVKTPRFCAWLAGTGITLAVFMGVLGFLALSIWIENSHPAEDAGRALAPAAQRVVTKPVVRLLSRQLDRYIRHQTEARLFNTGQSLEATIAWFLDERGDWKDRRFHAFRLAYAGTPEADAALRKILATAPAEHRAYMVQLIGSTGNPAGKRWLLPLLGDADENVVIAAIRGLCAMGGDDVTARIATTFADASRPESVRFEAARGLGTLGTPSARTALVEAFRQAPTMGMAKEILTSLGRFAFPLVAEDFQTYLVSGGIAPELRVVAAESLAFSTSEAVPFLAEVAGSDPDAAVRAAAAWSISAHPEDQSLGATLAGLAETEMDVDVRRRLYEAALPQGNIPGERLLLVVRAETDIAARVAGFNAIGRAAGLQPASAAAATFDNEIIPELVEIATTLNSLNIQMRAVFALRRAQTPAARAALAVISEKARHPVAAAARNGLPRSNS